MSDWFQAFPAVVAALALVTLPGLPVAWLLRLRGLTLVAGSVAASIASIALASIGAPALGVSWGILPIAAVAVALALAGLPFYFITSHVKPPSTLLTLRSSLWVAVAVILAGLLIGVEIVQAIGSPENISQTYDGVFHVNAVAEILLTGDPSPFHMDLSSPGTNGAFYPTLWHSAVALVAQIVGASVPVATNAVALVTSSWIWPVGILFFSRPFFVKRPAHLILGAVLAANFTAFPYLLLAWGVLYPNLLSTALIPFALGFIYPALRHRQTHSQAPLVSLWIAAVGAVGAATLAHPNALFGIAAFTVPMLLVTANDVRKLSLSRLQKSLRLGTIIAVITLYVIIWSRVRTGDNKREFGNSVGQAFVNGISNAQMLDTRAWFLTVLVAGGVAVLLVTRRHRWLILSYGVALGLFVVASGLSGSVRDAITGAWYNDAHRLAALLPIGAIPLAAVACAKLLDYVTAGLKNVDPERVSERARKYLPAVGAVVVFALILTGARGQGLALQTRWIQDLHNPAGMLLSEDERTLLERLPDEVPADALIAGDPWTGTGLALAIAQREVLFAHLNGNYSISSGELAAEFSMLGEAACPLVRELGVSYMLDFGDERYSIGEDELYKKYSGLSDIAQSPVVTEIDREGDAALYRVDCD
ncbi:hypothetical protein FB468_1846 [Leucobacter komagatae]|uniref:4-amino-4-deoxy-L-arabinose transferase-like glycosyltransferase n=1 Tax=Leucobacter komagatae TaxID=55969 RepID=A0A542Y6R7_9MICO|nr:DUF6541 family protein [Leucobacter komagatae]TQL43809.1 hypothetical protein FB468_1846 [Leucobacter komagatae]